LSQFIMHSLFSQHKPYTTHVFELRIDTSLVIWISFRLLAPFQDHLRHAFRKTSVL
jgi:hypothetical protein